MVSPAPQKRRAVTCSLDSSDRETQGMVSDLYGFIEPPLWNQSRRTQDRDGPFEPNSNVVQAREKVHGVARLIGGSFSYPKLRAYSTFEGGLNKHCEQQLVAELDEALKQCVTKALEPKHMRELRVLIEHELVCQDCYQTLEAFCKKNEIVQFNVYRPTRLSRVTSNKLVAGSSCMRGAWGDDIEVQLTAHWPCNGSFKQLRAPEQDLFFYACGCDSRM